MRQIRSEGRVISKEFVKWAKQLQILSIKTPDLWKVVMSRRHLLPTHMQGDYVSQEACDFLLLDFIVSYSLGTMPDEDDVTHVSYVNTMRALQFERPTFYIERTLADALLRTDVPLDLQVEDIHWVYPQLRVYVPNDLIAINRNGVRSPTMFVDICMAEKNGIYQMPQRLQTELRGIGANYFPEHRVPADSLILSTFLHFDCPEGNINYCTTAPWKGTTLRQMIDVGNTHELMSGMKVDETDHEFMARMTCFAMNVLLRLSSMPQAEREELKQTKVIRKPKSEGKRLIVGLYAAKVIGMGNDHVPTKPYEKGPPTGRHVVAHWKRGHWKRQPYGPKASLRRFQWIAPYHTYAYEESKNN